MIKMSAPEQWKQFRDTDYYFSDQGRFKHKLKHTERFLNGTVRVSRRGNKQIELKIDGKVYQVKDIVWELFKGEKPKNKYICHKNQLYRDNSIYNLVALDKVDVGKIYGGRVKTARYIINLDTKKVIRGIRGAGKANYCSYQTISDICNGKTKKPSVNVAWYDKDNEVAYRGEYRYSDEM